MAHEHYYAHLFHGFVQLACRAVACANVLHVYFNAHCLHKWVLMLRTFDVCLVLSVIVFCVPIVDGKERAGAS